MSNNSRLALPLISVVSTLTILGSPSEALALKRGDNNSQVKNVQSCLKRLGYFNGPENGNFGPMTEAAVKKFQQASRISAIGIVGPKPQLHYNAGVARVKLRFLLILVSNNLKAVAMVLL